ncbi:MAG: hypothetical protein NC311_09695 [Muribaculaceae bacterium]|nr:hypothetical protein [Muribaculaceae bacterium]
MADKLVFPIGFDLEAGLKQAQTDITRVVRRLDDAVKNQNVRVPVGFDEAMAKRLRDEAKDIERVLANIKNNYGNGQLKGLSIGFINTQKELDAIKRLQAQLQSMREQRTSLVNAGAMEAELKKMDSAIKQTEQRLKELNHAFSRDNSFNIAISQQIIKLKNLSEELAGIDRMYARLQASAGAAGQSANSFAANGMLVRRREIMEEIARVTKTATEAQKELFGIKGIGNGAAQGIFGYGGEQGLSAITEQITRYEQLKKELQDVEGQYERLKAMQAQGMGDQSEKINQTLQRRIAIQKELGEITQTAADAQKKLEENAKKTAAAFQRGRSAIDNFNRTMKLPENRIMNIQAKITALNQALKRVGIGSTEFNKIVAELNRLGQKLDEAKAKQQALTSEQEKGSKKVSGAFREQHSYLNILIQRLAVYSSLGAVMGFLTKVREVTAQFELQRISLGAIINDQVRANSLFNEIKQFALQSPIKILDLTKYTKQLAAFRFETDTLFDSTKRLADISVGLSVPMDRLIIALGHVKAATHLTGITLRQFSMAGIPMLELLAQQYSDLEGRAVSVADVQKRVHDKMVSFEDVNQVFTDLTSKGGMFYNMQIKQGNTLYGLWAKLGDAASVMYEQIGNTPFVNAGMKDAINMLTVMMRNWKDVARIVAEAGIAFGIYRLAVIASTKATALATVWNKKDILLRQMHLKTVMAQSWSVRNFNKVLLTSGVSAQKASTATWVFSRALNGLRAAIATTGIGLLIVGISLLIDRLIFGKSAADELAESLDRIKLESSQEQAKSVANFERLANVAVSSTSSYKQQQEALEELKRTYKGIIAEENLTIENLKAMNGHYEQLTASVREYINQQMKQKQIDEITNTYAYDILKIQRKVRDELKNKYSDEQLMEFWDRYAQNVKDKTKSAGKSVAEMINMTVSEMGASMQFAHDLGSAWTLWAYDHADVSRMTYLMKDQERQIEALGNVYDSASMALGKFADKYNDAVNSIKENGVSLNGNILNEKDNPLLFNQQEANLEVKDAMIPTIKEAFKEAGMAFDEGWVSLIDNIDENAPHLISSIDFEPMIEKAKSETKRLQDELQAQLEILIAQREAYMKQIQAEEGKGKGKNDEAIANAKAQYDDLGESIAVLEEKAKNINTVLPLLENLRGKFENLAPSDSVVKLMRQRFDQIVDYTKSYAKNMRRFRMDADESMEAYRKRLTDEVELIKKNIKAWSAAMILARLFRNKTEEQNLQNLIDEAKLQLADLEKILGDMPVFDKSKGGKKSDPRLQNLKEEISLVQKLYQEYKQLEKQEGASKAASDMERMAKASIDALSKKYGISLPKTANDVASALEILYGKMAQLPKKVFPALDKDLKELRWTIEKVDIDESQKQIEKQLKDLADRISRTKTAKEFYEKILEQTGDVELAAKLSLSLYGENGEDLKKQVALQINDLMQSGEGGIEIGLDVINSDFEINYKNLRKLIEETYKAKKIGDDAYKSLIAIADNGEKDVSKMIDGWLKATEKAKGYSDKMLDLARTTNEAIAKIEAQRKAGNITDDFAKSQTDGLRKKQAEEESKLMYEAFKDSPMYVQMFDDLDNASTRMLTNMKSRIESLKSNWKDLNPTQLKELQSRLNEIDAQLAKRNPFRGLTDGIKAYRKLMKEGDARSNKSEKDASQDLIDTAKAADDARKEYEEILHKDGATKEEIAEAKAKLDAAMANEEAAQKAVENWKKVKDQIGLSANELFQMLNWAGDIAQGIADISEAMGADEEDVQYWNDVADALGEISGGIQDIVQAAMSGNVVGIISSTLTAIPKMFVGFTNLFSAGKVKRANKEIKRQQELLDQLEYTYGRLEKAMEKAFGGDYINNFKAQKKNLEAQVAAYEKQLAAENSKGKKTDKAKVKEYEEVIRDTKDALAELEGEVAQQMLGTDLTSAARDFAQAWLDAYKEFGNTADAMSDKFKEMIENMVVEGALAKVMERALQPMFDMIDNMGEQDFYSESFWKQVVAKAEQGAKDADYGAQTMMKFLEQAGISMRDLGGDLTGISRDIASASEESINGLAAGINTQNFYISQIHADVAQIKALMGGDVSVSNVTTDYTPLIQQSLENQGQMIRYQVETLAECKKIASQCVDQTDYMRKVIFTEGGKQKIRVGC